MKTLYGLLENGTSFPGIKKLIWTAVFLLAGAAVFPLLSQPGLLNTRGGGDSPFLLQRLHQLVTAVLDGHFPVRWMPDANYGFGYPFYNYYAPLSIYIAALFRFLGFTYVGAIKAAQAAGFLTAAAGTLILGRRWFKSNWAGLLAAAAYTFAPFHMVNIYVRGDSLAEFWAMAFYPLVIITADNLVQQPKKLHHLALFALAYAALILSHNISALIFTPFLLLYLLVIIHRKKSNQTKSATSAIPNSQFPIPNSLFTIHYSLLSLLLALALSAWFWLPALAEQSLAQLGPVTAGYFHYSNHFRGADLVQASFLFDYDVAGGLAFRMGLIQLIVIGLGSAVLLWAALRKKVVPLWLAGFLILAVIIATLMITPLSRPLWDNLPLLPFTQFPWRFLSVQAFFGALAAGGLALLPGRKWIAPIIILVIVVSGLGDLKTDHLYLTDADVTAERLAEYEWFTGNIGSTVSAEYLPDYVNPRPFTSPWLNTGDRLAVLATNTDFEAQPLALETDQQSWRINTDDTADITFPLLDWPGWEVVIDGTAVDSHPAPGSGLIMVSVPGGEHTLDFHLARTPVRAAAEIVSTIAFLIAALLLWPAARRQANRRHLRWGAAGLTALLVLGIGLRLWPQPALADDTLSWDFEQSGYLHHSPGGIPFQGNLRLLGYTYSQDSAAPGQEITIILEWENGTGAAAELALTTPAVQRYEDAPILIAQNQTVESGRVTYRLVVPDNAPAGLYVPRLTVTGAMALTGSGLPRGDLFLRPIRIFGRAQLAENAAPLDAQAVNIGYQSPDVLMVQMQWLTMQPLTENYNVSLRLIDDNGLLVAQRDAQPGFGYLPSSGWLPGRWQNDWLTLTLPSDFSAEQQTAAPYALVARLYDVETEEVVLIRRLGHMVWQGEVLAFEEPPRLLVPTEPFIPPPATFEGLVHLESYEIEQSADFLDLTLSWHALADIQENFFHFVHLVDPQTGNIIAQHDSMPRNNTYPTSQWISSEIIFDPVRLSLADLPPGEYLLYIGLYRNLGDTFPPLTAVDETGQPLDGNRLFLQNIVIE